MLRRKPTALTITNEDINTFEEVHRRRIAYAKFLATGEDPEGLFAKRGNPENADAQMNTNGRQLQQQQQQQQNGSGLPGGGGAVDPNDELKPLPGDKARIVRSREERIGVGGGNAR